ncbi:hypothetical protein K7432_015634 [Basidiobolus ranarum]|uniref:TLC domain-containing protein n=1 Tax=Basidiobolus ranarum TaxID=34480 RepID=A0ABR2VMU0_9FUNG
MEYSLSSEDFFDQFGLSKLAHHWPTLLLSTLTCQLIIYASRMVSPLLFPKAYGSLKSIKRLSWDVHVVSLVHCIVICTLAFPLHWDPELVRDKIYGYSERTGEVYAIASGYFLWDTIFHVSHLKEFGIGFAVHGVACFCLGINSYVSEQVIISHSPCPVNNKLIVVATIFNVFWMRILDVRIEYTVFEFPLVHGM